MAIVVGESMFEDVRYKKTSSLYKKHVYESLKVKLD